jgi:tripartite-type tricarboxylate transporter receptor subunit TctC
MMKRATSVLSAAFLIAPVFALAQTYPVKPIRMIAPFPPGGTTDVVCRIVAQQLTDGLGKQIIVDNRPGASGSIGHELAARSAPDGYTLLLTAKAALVVNPLLYKHLGYSPLNDFEPISLVASAGPVLVVHPSLPVKNVQELIALAKAKPGQLNFGSGGKGTTAHLIGEVFKAITGTNMVHVPYKGGILAVTDLVAGHIQLSFSDMVPAVPQIKAGRLRALAVTTPQRSPTIPDIPTMAEAGINQPFPQQWWAVAAPKGTPAPIVSRINAVIAQMVGLPELKERFADLGVFPAHSTPERMRELIRIEAPEMEKYLKIAGVEPE